MKKLMIAAAVAAMAGGAFAANNWTNVYFVVSNTVTKAMETNDFIRLPETSILTYKRAKFSEKVFSLNKENFDGESKKFKAFKTGVTADGKAGYVRAATDGVIYYDTTRLTNRWVTLEWNKNQKREKTCRAFAPTFNVFGNDRDPAKATVAYASFNGLGLGDWTVDGTTNAVTDCYAKLKVKGGTVDTTITSLKSLDKDIKISVKNYKDAEACKKAVDKFVKKYGKSEAKEDLTENATWGY